MDLIDLIKDESQHRYQTDAVFMSLSNPLKDLIRRLLKPNPENRLKASGMIGVFYVSGALRHPWSLTKCESGIKWAHDDMYLEIQK